MYITRKIFQLSLSLLVFAGLFSSACNRSTETEQEIITTVEVHLTGANFEHKYYWKDLDGVGGANPVIDTIIVPAATGNISCHLHAYDESKTPVVDVTDEVEAENTAHLFTYSVAGANYTIAYNDQDDNGKNFGLETLWTSTSASVGTVTIRLFHEPTDKSNLSAPGGEVDFEVTFPVKVQ